MAHTPDYPERFVCMNCQVVHAGTAVHREDGGHNFVAPDACGACEASDFVELSSYVRHHE